ncbi:MAG: tetratricopeptide repeat protein [Desulfobacterales bacterium]|nr:MAG: tetratricopeptide repeat protein [Desulfobacterales bacterium]
MKSDRVFQDLTREGLHKPRRSSNQTQPPAPDHPDALHRSGIIAFQAGDHTTALDRISRAIAQNPSAPSYHNNLGLVLESSGKQTEAVRAYRMALKLHPYYADAYNNLGNVLRQQERMDQAIANFKAALRIAPDFPEAHFNLALSYRDKGLLEAAMEHYRQAIRLKPNYDKAYNSLGNALKQLGRLDEAVENYRRALRHNPESVGVLNNLAIALRAKGRIQDAAECMIRAIQLKPGWAESYCNLGNLLKDQNRFDAALKQYHRAIRLKPDFVEAYFNRAITHLLLENFEEGWKEYEWRLQKPEWKKIHALHTHLIRWEGQNFHDRRLLVYDEQGFGDALQFVRYLPLVKARGGTVVFQTRKPLMALFKFLAGVDELEERTPDAASSNSSDFYVPLASLPGIFNTRLETIPADIPYLQADIAKVKHWPNRLADQGHHVGIVWAGTDTDPNRTCPFRHFLPLSGIAGVNLYGLQQAAPAVIISGSTGSHDVQIPNFGPEFEDFSDTAALIANLDLVISIDTSVAHLAGALGKPVWVLLPHNADWRWLLDREDSPWYPTMRLFRQKTRGDWSEVFDRVAQNLQQKMESRPGHLDWRPATHQAEALYHQGNRQYDNQKFAAAQVCYQKALEIRPDFFEACFNLAKTHQDLGNHDRAIFFYRRALALNQDFAEAHYNMGVSLQEGENYRQAIESYRKALKIKPQFAEAQQNMGSCFQHLNQPEQAIACYKKALELKPEAAQAHYNIGKILYDLAEWEKAGASFQKALDFKPDYAEACHNMGLVYYRRNRLDDAMACFQKALRLKPSHVNTYYDLGNVYRDRGELDGMIGCYQKALELEPDSAQAYHNLSVAFRNLNNMDQAIACCSKALQIRPDYSDSAAYLVQLLQHACEWEKLPDASDRLDRLTQKELDRGEKTSEQPMLSQRRHSDPGRNLAIAESWSRDIQRRAAGLDIHFSFAERKSVKKEMTVGYLSGDFKNHAVMHQMLGLFGLHDRNRFNVYCYSHGKDDGSFYRQKIMQDCDKFTELDNLSHYEAAKCIYTDKVDILVDLMGHTRSNRLAICALRPSPIQVSYLGFLGTTGAAFIDYFITDKIVTPEDQSIFYSEKLVFLPDCYQVNDHHQKISEKQWQKKECGLPAEGFVFCCFNQPYKIDPHMFDTWMRILRRIPQSVLWLLNQNSTATKNLQRRAQAQGISPSRLIFADALPLEDHLARLRLADLALDTRIYNGGATTSNALWAGVPVITLQGDHFVSRMSSSSLSAVGLPELITRNLNTYETLAVELARGPDKLQAIRKKLARNRLTYPLFDTPRFVKNLETAYQAMWEIFTGGNSPQPIEVVEKRS